MDLSQQAVPHRQQAVPDPTAATPAPLAGAAREAALQSVGLSDALLERFREGSECSFWFVKASAIRSGELAPPVAPLQELRRTRPDVLQQATITLGGLYVKRILVVSHRWEDPAKPDVRGSQHAAIVAHLEAHLEIELVWYDYWCMPQSSIPKRRPEPT